MFYRIQVSATHLGNSQRGKEGADGFLVFAVVLSWDVGGALSLSGSGVRMSGRLGRNECCLIRRIRLVLLLTNISSVRPGQILRDGLVLSIGRSLTLVEHHHLLHEVLLVVLNVARGHVQHVKEVLLHKEVQLFLIALDHFFAHQIIVFFLVLGRLRK